MESRGKWSWRSCSLSSSYLFLSSGPAPCHDVCMCSHWWAPTGQYPLLSSLWHLTLRHQVTGADANICHLSHPRGALSPTGHHDHSSGQSEIHNTNTIIKYNNLHLGECLLPQVILHVIHGGAHGGHCYRALQSSQVSHEHSPFTNLYLDDSLQDGSGWGFCWWWEVPPGGCCSASCYQLPSSPCGSLTPPPQPWWYPS